jgi:glutamate carboxypeptidase
MMQAEQFREYFEENMPSYLALLRQMVRINSFTVNPAGVNKLGEVTAVAFEELGFESETIQSDKPHYGKHVVLTRYGKSGRQIGLVSHLDTVFPPDEERRNNFAWRQEGERIYGPRTVVIKGGTVIIYMMMAALQAIAPEAYEDITWVVLLDASEEADAEDFGALCIERLEGSQTLGCLIFEGGYFDGEEFWLVTARKGMAMCDVQVEGKAAHAGSAHPRGANAIVQMGQTIQQLAAVTNYERGVTVNVGMVNGGTVTNRVPHQARAALEMRAFDKGAYDEAVAAMLALNGEGSVRSADGDFTCTVSVEVVRRTAPWPRNEGTDRLLTVWQEAADSLGYRVVREERGGLSDGNHFWHRVPTIDGLGVAGGNAHCSERSQDGSKEQEYCEVGSFVPKALLNVTAVLQLISNDVIA